VQKVAFKYDDVEVKEEGRVELSVPLPSGVRVTVFVIEESGEKFADLVSAARSSLDFWDNPLDDEDWNNAWAGRHCPRSYPVYWSLVQTAPTGNCGFQQLIQPEDQDMVVVAMTSNLQPMDYSFTITSADLTQGTLNRPGKVRMDRVYTLAQTLAVKIFGRVNQTTLAHIHSLLQELVVEKS
jgi:hypothetical protein